MPDTDARPSGELQELADLAIDAGATEPMGVHLFASDDRRAELARHVERVVFGASFGNTTDLLAAEYGPYEPQSIFLCVLDYRRRLPAGVLRLILPDLEGSSTKTFDDIEPIWGVPVDEMLRRSGVRMPRRSTWDMATLAVDPAYRTPAAIGLVSTALFQAMSQLTLRCHVDWLVAILDQRVYRLLQRTLQHPVHEFDGIGPLPYLGSAASLPVWLQRSEWEARLLQTDLTLHGIIYNGAGLEGAVRPLDPSIPPQLIAWLLEREPSGRRGDRDTVASPPATGTS